MLFRDREDAGRQLGAALLRFKAQQPLVLALPRGGVPVGFEIARALEAPLDIILVRKIGAPDEPELAIGAIVDGERLDQVIDDNLVAELQVPETYLKAEIARQLREIERRRQLYSAGRLPVAVRQRVAVVVDDGIATGATMRAALRAVRRREPARLVMAVPVAPRETIERLHREVDEIVCLDTPDPFFAIGQFYRDFRQLDDQEVVDLLNRATRPHMAAPGPADKRETPAR